MPRQFLDRPCWSAPHRQMRTERMSQDVHAPILQVRVARRTTALTPLYVKTLVQAAWMIPWRARKSVMTRW